MSPLAALQHPWLARAKEAAGEALNKLKPPPVVQKIQRYGEFGNVKRSLLEKIADNVLKQQTAYTLKRQATIGYLDDEVGADTPAQVLSRQHKSDGALSCITEESTGTSCASGALQLDAGPGTRLSMESFAAAAAAPAPAAEPVLPQQDPLATRLQVRALQPAHSHSQACFHACCKRLYRCLCIALLLSYLSCV